MKVRVAILLSLVVLVSLPASAQTSPIVPAKVWKAFENEINGDNSYDLLRHLTLYHAPNGSNDDFEAEANWVAAKAREYGLTDVKIMWLGGGGKPWNVTAGEAWIVEPEEIKLGDILESPLRVATNSRSADLTAELVDVGAGTSDADYEGIDVKGKVVLASGNASAVQRQAVWKHGAAGVISYSPQRAYFPDQVAFARVPGPSPNDQGTTFAFMLSQREGDGLKARVAQYKREGKTVRVKIKIETSFMEERQGIVEGWISGTHPNNDDIVLTSHLQEEKTSANDDRSGVANMLEIARTMMKLINEGKLPRPRRNIRFWWLDEIGAQYRYFGDNPEASKTMLVNLNQDMVGAKQSVGFRVQFMSRTPYSRPSFLNDVAESVVNAVIWGNTAAPLRRGSNSSAFSAPMFALKGTREPYRAMPVPFYNSTDHMPFNDGRVGVPGISLTNWPDTYIHSTDDDLWQIDATQLKRNAFIISTTAYTIATLGDGDMPRLTALLLGGAQQRLARDSAVALNRLHDESAGTLAERYKDAVMLQLVAFQRESGAIASLRRLTTPGSPGSKMIEDAFDNAWKLSDSLRADLASYYQATTGNAPEITLTPEEEAANKQVPAWKTSLLDSLTGKVNVPRGISGLHGHYAFEVRNLINGQRSVLDIYFMVRAAALSAGEWYYGPVEFKTVKQYFDNLEKAGAIEIEQK